MAAEDPSGLLHEELLVPTRLRGRDLPLHPPSFFKAPQTGEGDSQPLAESGRGVASAAVCHHSDSGWREELAQLKQENQELRRQLGTIMSLAPPCDSARPSFIATPSTLPAVLASDLLQVETHLQSKVKLLEGERKELSVQVLELERSLLRVREQHQTELDTLRSQQEEAFLQLRAEIERLGVGWERERGRVGELEEEGASLEQQHAAQVEGLQERITLLEQNNTALSSELSQEKSDRDGEVAELRTQLAAREREGENTQRQLQQQLSVLEGDLSGARERVGQLEAYLGGELPQEEGRTLTWREEREELSGRIQGYERENQRLQSEARLLNIRLASLSEILSIQETEVAKSGGGGGEGGGWMGAVKGLLSRWREKVFVLLVQQKLQQLEDSRARHEARVREERLVEEKAGVEREKELLSLALADKAAEMELQCSRTEELSQNLEEALSTIASLEQQGQRQHQLSQHLGFSVQGVVEAYRRCKTTVDQALSRTANYEHRLAFANRRLSSLKASVSCYLAMVQRCPRSVVDRDSQTEPAAECPDLQEMDIASFSREQLIAEVSALTREREALARQLTESTSVFEQQIKTLSDNCSSKLAVLEERVCHLQGEKGELSEQLSQLASQHGALESERDSLSERALQLEREARDLTATLETRIEAAMLEQQQRSSEELSEMEKLLEVARREHAKAVVQLQHLQRQAGREKERAVEAVELGRAQVEQELESCRKKLQSVQAERNLLLTTLRQEGIVVPVKRPPPRGLPPTTVENQDSDVDSSEPLENGQSPKDPLRDVFAESGSCLSDDQSDSESGSQLEFQGAEHRLQSVADTSSGGLPSLLTAAAPDAVLQDHNTETSQQDIREVLKDLQQLSASLLGMETSKPP